MPFNDRRLFVLKAEKDKVSAAPSEYKMMPMGPNSRNDKEYEAEGIVNRAAEVASQSAQYFDDFADRVRRAGRLHADILNRPLKDIKAWDKPTKPPLMAT